MVDAYLGEIRLFAGNYAPENWALCNGQLESIQNNPALFALLGTQFGGDGQTTFGLPDLRGRMVVGSSPYFQLASEGGTESVSLTQNNLPAHSHTVLAYNGTETPVNGPQGAVFGKTTGQSVYTGTPTTTLSPDTVQPSAGGTAAHENRQPSLALSYIIALTGLFPNLQ